MLPYLIPQKLIGNVIDYIVEWLIADFGDVFDAVADGLGVVISSVETFWIAVPPLLIIVGVAFIGWYLTKKYSVGAFILVGLYLVYNMGLWEPLMETLTLITIGVIISLIIGIPIGILAAKSDIAWSIIRPVLDFMQTMHPFVYLIPVVFLFGLGMVPGLLCTIVFAVPAPIRLTNLGIRQVRKDLVEVGVSFGSTPLQLLRTVELPLAIPSIMQGVNQCIMLSLSMVIIASMIAAGGLGDEIQIAIQRLDIGRGMEAGFAVVILAITLDRISTSRRRKKSTG